MLRLKGKRNGDPIGIDSDFITSSFFHLNIDEQGGRKEISQVYKNFEAIVYAHPFSWGTWENVRLC